MTFKVIRGQGQGQEMTSVPYQDYFCNFLYSVRFTNILKLLEFWQPTSEFRRSGMYSGVCLVNEQAQLVLDPLGDWYPWYNSWRVGVTRSRDLRSRMVRAAVYTRLAGTVPVWKL